MRVLLLMRQEHDRVRIDPVMFIYCGKERRQFINT